VRYEPLLRTLVLQWVRSIGEAETYRYYWKRYWGWFFGLFAPSWLGRQNTEWRGNYGVRYWQPDWQRIIFSGENVARLKLLAAERKPVFVVEYLDAPQEIERARKQLEGYGFIPYFADRALDQMPTGDLPEKK
jgi:endo-alpha-1,4-polygalactosaminidase (GH114 family)